MVVVAVVSVVVYSGLGVETRGLFGMATEQVAQMFGQLQQLSQQLVNQQQMFQQRLEMQRQQSQVQMETLTNLGAAQVAKTTYDARDFQTKAFSKTKSSKGERKLGQIGGTSFVSRHRGVSVKRLRSWIGLRTDTISRFLSLTSNNKLLRGRIGLTWQSSTCSFMVIWFLSWKSALRGSKLCVTPRLDGDD